MRGMKLRLLLMGIIIPVIGTGIMIRRGYSDLALGFVILGLVLLVGGLVMRNV